LEKEASKQTKRAKASNVKNVNRENPGISV